MRSESDLSRLVMELFGDRPSALSSLKAGDRLLGGVDTRSDIHRVSFADGRSAILKVFEEEPAAREEQHNLRFLRLIAPEHTPGLLASSAMALLTEDVGVETLATLCARDDPACRDAWLRWAEAVATVHARSAGALAELSATYAPDEPRREMLPGPERMLAILARLVHETRGLGVSADASAELAECLGELGRRIGGWEERDTVFGFHDHNPMNVIVRDGGVLFVDVGGPALGVAVRALSEVWRAPVPGEVFRRYVEMRRELGASFTEEELREEREVYEVASCILWLERHLDAAPAGGIPDVDGTRAGYSVVEKLNLVSLRDLGRGRSWLHPLPSFAELLLDTPLATARSPMPRQSAP